MNTNHLLFCARSFNAIVITLLACALTEPVHGRNPTLTLTNPAPALGETFGQTVGTVGDKMLIANSRDAGDAGSVSLYSSNGVLIRAFHNPSRANGEFFGVSSSNSGLTCGICASESTVRATASRRIY